MNIARIASRTVVYADSGTRTEHVIVIGKEQGFLPLPVRIGVEEGTGIGTMTTAWEPTPAELEALQAGARIYVQLLGQGGHPPIIVFVGSVPSEDSPVEVEPPGPYAPTTLIDRVLLNAARHGLRSYQNGNSAPDLAKAIADKIDQRVGPEGDKLEISKVQDHRVRAAAEQLCRYGGRPAIDPIYWAIEALAALNDDLCRAKSRESVRENIGKVEAALEAIRQVSGAA